MSGADVPDAGAARLAGLTPLALLAIVVALAWAYTYRLASNPLKWEEPRRCLVAMEMIHTGNYITPRLLGEPYLKKPPLQNWLIAFAAGLDPARVGPLAARSISVLALAASCFVLWSLGTDGNRPGRDPLPAVILATTGTVIQHGRAGEIDMLFSFLVLAAVAFFELGRRRSQRSVQWLISQVLLAAGVLAKWIAPLFFYPPALWLAWRHRADYRPATWPLLGGLLALLLLIGAWLVPFWQLSPSSGLEQRLWSEVAARTAGQGVAGAVRHVITYPVLVFAAFLPWSLGLVSLGSVSRSRAAARLVRHDPWLRLSATIVAWTIVVFLFVPEQKARYLMPAFPFAAVLLARLVEERISWLAPRAASTGASRRPLAWALAVVAWIGVAWGVGADQLATRGPVLALAFAGAGVLAACGAFAAWGRRSVPAAPLLVMGLLYAVVHATLLEAREAERNTTYAAAAEQFAGTITDERPVVVHRQVSLKLAQPLTQKLARPLGRRVEPRASAWWIAPATLPGPDPSAAAPGSPTVHGSLALWDVSAPEAWSMMGRPLFPPPLAGSVRLEREAALATAAALHEANPGDADATIWLGRRLAYLGRYRDAIEVFGRGIVRHPSDARLLRHRGHRFITVREPAAAIADLRAAASLVEGRPDEVEPDGLPNARGIPTSTLQTNIWYHLGLAHYLRGELVEAEQCYRRSVALATNDDMLAAATHWLYMTVRRQGDEAAAREALEPIHAGMEIIENRAYFELLLLYRGESSPEAVLAWADQGDEVAFASAAYGVANWHLVAGRREQAAALLSRIVDRGAWTAFGHLAAEADLARIWDRAL